MIGNPFQPDNLHVYDHVVEFVLDLFARHYTANGNIRHAAPAWPPVADEAAQIAELEMRNAELQQVCNERLWVIEDLKRVCDERLALIEKLHATLNGA